MKDMTKIAAIGMMFGIGFGLGFDLWGSVSYLIRSGIAMIGG